MKTVHCPIYVALGGEKYVKTHHAGTQFDQPLLKKYTDKKVYHLFIERQDFQSFIGDFQKFVGESLDKGNTDALDNITSKSLDMVKCIQDDIGLTPEIEKLTLQNIDLVLKLSDGADSLKNISTRFEKAEGSHFSQHCIMTAMIATSIGKKLNWVSDKTSSKLAFAAIMHDSALPLALWERYEMCIDPGQQEKIKAEMTSEELRQLNSHCTVAAELAKQWKTCPTDVDTIIIQHHEKADGTGFPAKLQGHRIAPLAAIFIVSHDLAIDLILQHGDLDIDKWILEHKDIYGSGDFKKAIGALMSSPKAA